MYATGVGVLLVCDSVGNVHKVCPIVKYMCNIKFCVGYNNPSIIIIKTVPYAVNSAHTMIVSLLLCVDKAMLVVGLTVCGSLSWNSFVVGGSVDSVGVGTTRYVVWWLFYAVVCVLGFNDPSIININFGAHETI